MTSAHRVVIAYAALAVHCGSSESAPAHPTIAVRVFAEVGNDVDDAERSVAIPLERALSGTPGALHVKSLTEPGRVAIDVGLDPHTVPFAARQSILARLPEA